MDPLDFNVDVESKKYAFARLEALERDLFRRLVRLGYDVLPTVRSPFEALTQHEETTLLTGVGGSEIPIERKASVVSSIGRVVERDAVLFVERRFVRASINGVPVIAREELRRAKDLDAVEELIAERKG